MPLSFTLTTLPFFKRVMYVKLAGVVREMLLSVEFLPKM